MNLSKKYIRIGAILAMFSIILGAFGAHALKNILEPQKLETFKTGIDYQMYHALYLVVLGILKHQFPSINLGKAFAFGLAGIILFSMNCCLYAITGIKTFAMIVPFGGVSFILSWLFLFLAVRKSESI